MSRSPISAGPRIEITPTQDEYDQLCHDLALLRTGGAASHTEAVIRAVRKAAEEVELRGGVK
jgi:hypothetical protein